MLGPVQRAPHPQCLTESLSPSPVPLPFAYESPAVLAALRRAQICAEASCSCSCPYKTCLAIFNKCLVNNLSLTLFKDSCPASVPSLSRIINIPSSPGLFPSAYKQAGAALGRRPSLASPASSPLYPMSAPGPLLCLLRGASRSPYLPLESARGSSLGEHGSLPAHSVLPRPTAWHVSSLLGGLSALGSVPSPLPGTQWAALQAFGLDWHLSLGNFSRPCGW